MEGWRRPDSRIEFTPDFWRGLVEKIVAEEETLGDLARATGIPREVLRKWARMFQRADATARKEDEFLVPASRVRELEREIQELRRLLNAREGREIEGQGSSVSK